MSEYILDIAHRVRELSEAATPGPWYTEGRGGIQMDGISDLYVVDYEQGGGGHRIARTGPGNRKDGGHNAAFIAETRTAAPQLAAAVERMAAALREQIATVIWMSGSDDFAPEGKGGSHWPERRERLFAAMDALRELGIPLTEDGDE